MPKIPLTKAKRKWAKNRDVNLVGIPLNYNVSQQIKYQRALMNLVLQMTTEVKKQVIKLFKGKSAKDFVKQQKQASAMDESISNSAKVLMSSLTRKFQKLFDNKANNLADNMLKGITAASSSAVYMSLKQLSGGLSLKGSIVSKGMEDISRAIVAENVSLIKSIPAKYLDDVTGAVMRSITTGKGLVDLVPELKKYEGITERRANNIAFDQTRKAYSTISKEKLQANGIKQFEWLHSAGGSKPRESHIRISGEIFSFENLEAEQATRGVPAQDRGIPGYPINCRCRMLPILTFDEE